MAYTVMPKHPMPSIPLTQAQPAALSPIFSRCGSPGSAQGQNSTACTANSNAHERLLSEERSTMKRAKIWYVIADGGRARFVERDDGGAFRTVSSLVAAELHKRSRDLCLDRPPRANESASPARHAIEPRRDLHQASKEDFVKLVADQLDEEHGRGQFDKLVLVAPPRALTELKQSLSNEMAKLVVSD